MEKTDDYSVDSNMLSTDYYSARRLIRKLNQVVDADFAILGSYLEDIGEPNILLRIGTSTGMKYMSFRRLAEYVYLDRELGPKVSYLKP